MGGVRGETSVEICGRHAKWRVEIRMSRSHPKHYASLYPQNVGELGSEGEELRANVGEVTPGAKYPELRDVICCRCNERLELKRGTREIER